MILVDENISRNQVRLLLSWGIRARQIGHEIARAGTLDEQIIPLLIQIRRSTFFTLDRDFFQPRLRHRNYCLVFLDVRDSEVATYIRRVLRYPNLRTRAQRMGAVVADSPLGLRIWRWAAHRETFVPW